MVDIRHLRTTLLCGLLAAATVPSHGQTFTESFDDITTLAGNGWLIQNNSTPVGPLTWFQGTPTTATPTPGPFNAYTGAANSYIGANFNSTGSTGTISNWLVMPNRTLRNGDVLTFYTRKPTIGSGQTDYPDRLEVRLSTNGASTNLGSGATGLGDFTTLMLSVNPTLVANVYPQVWTQYTITLSGLPAPTSGRMAFRYFVTGAGSLGTSSDYIGIDQVVYTPYTCPTLSITPTSVAGATAGTAYSQSLAQTGALGTPAYAVTAGALPPGVTLSAAGTISGTPTATGTFNFTTTVSDASGCSGARAYSITVVCGSNPTTLNNLPALCTNSALYTLTQGLPAGGTYSGTGVSAGTFDPAAGTQSITYDYTDPYGCSHSTSATITVDPAPEVSVTAFDALCANAGALTLTGAAPAGGTWSGTGVTDNFFDPASGTQELTYSYTDGNNCTAQASTTIQVNAAPVVEVQNLDAVCSNMLPVTLEGASPVGGTWSGTGVTNDTFDPTSGTQDLTYSYTDTSGCSNNATTTIQVNAAPVVEVQDLDAVCSNMLPVALEGATPAGGTWSGTGVTDNTFDPANGTQDLTYSYTDANSCTEVATTTIAVNDAPIVLMKPLAPLCSDAAPFAILGAVPADGTWSGTGVTDNIFDPASGTQDLTYTYTDQAGCSDTLTTTLVVNQTPEVSWDMTMDPLCVNHAAVVLFGVTPTGGTWSGPGVQGDTFDPAVAGVGVHLMTYSVTEEGCTGIAQTFINVDACAGIAETATAAVRVFPNPSTDHFFISGADELREVRVYDLTGAQVAVRIGKRTSNGTRIDLGNTPAGVYIVQGIMNERTFTVRLVKQ